MCSRTQIIWKPTTDVEPFFSIVLPAYNVAFYLESALSSLLLQRYKKWECICVDDGSLDDTYDVMECFIRQDVRIRGICQRNAGVSVARNRALDVAKGLYVAFLDGDDCYYTGALELAYNAIVRYWLEEKRIDFLHWRYNLLTQRCGVWECVEKKQKEEENFVDEATEVLQYYIEHFISGGMICGGVYRRAVIGDVRFVRGITMCEDALFHSMLCSRVTKILSTSIVAYKYRIHAQQSMNRKGIRMLRDQLLMIQQQAVAYNRHLQICSQIRKQLEGVVWSNVATEVVAHTMYRGGTLQIGGVVRRWVRKMKELGFERKDVKYGRKQFLLDLITVPMIGEVLCVCLSFVGIGLMCYRKWKFV